MNEYYDLIIWVVIAASVVQVAIILFGVWVIIGRRDEAYRKRYSEFVKHKAQVEADLEKRRNELDYF